MAAKTKTELEQERDALRNEVAEYERKLQEQETTLEEHGSTIQEMLTMLKQLADERGGAGSGGGMGVADVIQLIEHRAGSDRRFTYRPLEGEDRDALDEIDPFAWITENTQAVHFVGRTGSIPIRLEHHAPSGVKIPKKRLKKHMTTMWQMCPYRFGGKTPQDHAANMLMNRDWHFLRLTVRDAEEMWMGRYPFPVETVIRPQDLRGVENGEVFGKKVPSSGIPLREGARLILQQNRQMLWLNTDLYLPNFDGRYELEPWNIEGAPRGLSDDEVAELTGLPVKDVERLFRGRIDGNEPNPYSVGCPASTGNTGQPISPFRGAYNVNAGASASQNTAELLSVGRH